MVTCHAATIGVLAFTSIEQGLWVVEPELASLSNVVLGAQCPEDSSTTTWEMALDVLPGWVFPVTVEVEGVTLASGFVIAMGRGFARHRFDRIPSPGCGWGVASFALAVAAVDLEPRHLPTCGGLVRGICG